MNTPRKITNLDRVRRLLAHFESGDIPRLLVHEVNPGLARSSRENYLYFTLPVCINFQRGSPAMWAAALATYNDAATRYVFFPELLAEADPEQVRADLLLHKLALQPQKHVHIWTTIGRTLHEHYKDDPRNILLEANYSAAALIRLLQVTHKERFPYLCGPKLANYWAYMLSLFTDAVFADAQEISIIPDTHVIQSSMRLGLVTADASSAQVEHAWRELLAGSGIAPSQVHSVLWHWSRNNFWPAV